MAESFVQVAVDGAGKKIRNFLNNISGTDVYQQAVTLTKSDGTIIDDPSRSSVTQPVSGTFFQATQPVSLAAASEADGHSASIGATTDAANANTVIGRLKQLVALLAGGLPAALAASGGLKVDIAGTGANATAVKVDGSAVTQPISAASLPLPTGAALDATLSSTLPRDVTDRSARLLGHVTVDAVPTGQQLMAASLSVTMASDQIDITMRERRQMDELVAIGSYDQNMLAVLGTDRRGRINMMDRRASAGRGSSR